MLSADWHIKLTDFGTAKILNPTTTPSTSGATSEAENSPTPERNPEKGSEKGPERGSPFPTYWPLCLFFSAVRSNSFVGTAEYVSPELINSKETCCRYVLAVSFISSLYSANALYSSDLWALGSITYQMIANRLPFRGKTEFLTFQKVSTREFSFPPNFPPLAKDLIDNLLVLLHSPLRDIYPLDIYAVFSSRF